MKNERFSSGSHRPVLVPIQAQSAVVVPQVCLDGLWLFPIGGLTLRLPQLFQQRDGGALDSTAELPARASAEEFHEVLVASSGYILKCYFGAPWHHHTFSKPLK